MTTATLRKNLIPRREKLFGDGRPRPLDREAKVRIMARARGLMRRTEKGRHYGPVTAKAVAVLEALLWGFHNAGSGLCFPSYESIADRAGCARSTVAEAIKALEEAGLLSWVHRLYRKREWVRDLFGQWAPITKVWRTSNGYSFIDPRPGFLGTNNEKSSKSDFPSGTPIQDFISITAATVPTVADTDTPLSAALQSLGKALGAVS